MFGFPRDKEKERFYLLPGQGGKAYRHKRKIILIWSIVAGLLTSVLVGGAIYWLSVAR